MIARWQIDAKFGHKQQVVDSLKKWHEEIGTQVGWTADKTRILSGSVGVAESTVVSEIELRDLSDLNQAFEKLKTIKAHEKWSKDLEPYVVSGSHRWEVYRTI
jgi:hypothetical protein